MSSSGVEQPISARTMSRLQTTIGSKPTLVEDKSEFKTQKEQDPTDEIDIESLISAAKQSRNAEKKELAQED